MYNFQNLHGVAEQVEKIIIGKREQIRLALICILAGGHLLIEDVPGVGKTTLSHAFAMSLGLKFSRVQFTSDLLPSDITGASIFDREKADFIFRPGPIFTQVLLADEINRATPKTQSSLLEAMEEGQVTSDGISLKLPKPFFVIGTQNPSHQIGTYELPESQLDRFLMSISIGYPDAASEEAILLGARRRNMVDAIKPAIKEGALQEAQRALDDIHVSPALASYVRRLLGQSRNGKFVDGLSPRAGLGLIRAARACAALDSRLHVSPEDVQSVFASVVTHRLRPSRSEFSGASKASMVRDLMLSVAV
jgi:MoxR-like ATPase